jgi:hypothetical protein
VTNERDGDVGVVSAYQSFGLHYQAGCPTAPHLLLLSDRTIRRWEEEEQNISGRVQTLARRRAQR